MTAINKSRRGFLAVLGLAGAGAATAAMVVPIATAKAETGTFEHPAEYLAAMHSIGWTPLAMFHHRKDGSVQRMGVNETAPKDRVYETWSQFHAIQMRVPVQIAANMPQGECGNGSGSIFTTQAIAKT